MSTCPVDLDRGLDQGDGQSSKQERENPNTPMFRRQCTHFFAAGQGEQEASWALGVHTVGVAWRDRALAVAQPSCVPGETEHLPV